MPAAAGRALRKVAPRALEALNRRPDARRRAAAASAPTCEFVLTKRYSFGTDVPPSLVRFVAQMHAGTRSTSSPSCSRPSTAHDKLDALDVLNGVETLILVGEQDLLTPADHSRAMVEAVPGAELVILPDAGTWSCSSTTTSSPTTCATSSSARCGTAPRATA